MDYKDEYIELLKENNLKLREEIEKLKKDLEQIKQENNSTQRIFNDLININTVCNHEYPSPWWGIFPPPCRKCGYIPNYTITCFTV